jgi:hypothetical protein
MLENYTDTKAQVKDSSNNTAQNEHDALINKVAMEMNSAPGNNTALMSFEKAPDSALARYGLAAVKGVGYVPQGIVHAVEYDIKHPMQTLGTVATGAAMGAALKFVLPEGGPAGKIAAAAIGTYFTVQAVKPIYEGFKDAGNATTMKDLNMAAMKIGDAGGTFIVNSAVAGAGAKLGTYGAERLLATEAMTGFKVARADFYDKVGTQMSRATQAAGLTASDVPQTALAINPQAHALIPPYMLQELARRNPSNPDFLRTYQKTLEIENGKGTDAAKPRADAGKDYKGAREVYDAKGQETQPGEKARFEGEKPTGNVEVDKAYDFTGETRDFYLKEYKRNSIDGNGMKYVSTVNYGENYENAFWDGKQMTYGRPGPDSPFKTFVIRDVAGHEITHGVTEKVSDLKYYGQSGALNESISDVYGALIDQYAQKQTADQAKWIVGDGIWKDNVKGRGLRDMLNPGTAYDDPAVGKDPQPAHMKDYYKTYGDQGGVHYNSGIPNKAFATFAKEVGGNAWDDPGHIWFKARELAGSNPSFSQFAFQTVEAAKALGKTDLIPKLNAAWEGVGVKPDINIGDTTTPGGGGRVGDALASLFSWGKKK